MSFTGFLLVWLIAVGTSVVAELVLGFRASMLLATLVVGFLGALFGEWVAHATGWYSPLLLHVAGRPVDVLWSVACSGALLSVYGIIRKNYYWRPTI